MRGTSHSGTARRLVKYLAGVAIGFVLLGMFSARRSQEAANRAADAAQRAESARELAERAAAEAERPPVEPPVEAPAETPVGAETAP